MTKPNPRVQFKLDTQKIGPLYLVADGETLVGIFWKPQASPLLKTLGGKTAEEKFLKRAVAQIEEYLSGERSSFDLPLALEGTEFQKLVWNELQKIPYGETISYRELARRIKNEKAIRAVGTANGRNPVSLIVPCHRVIASDGTLGGYAGGLPIKTMLLELEKKSLGR